MFKYIKELNPYLQNISSLEALLRRDAELYCAQLINPEKLNQQFVAHAEQKLDKLFWEGLNSMRFDSLMADTSKFEPFVFLHYRALKYLKEKSEVMLQECTEHLKDFALSMNKDLLIHNALSDNVPVDIAERDAEKEANEAAVKIIFPQEVILPFLDAFYTKANSFLISFMNDYGWIIDASWEEAAVGKRATERLIQLLEMPQEQFEQTWANLETQLPVKNEFDNLTSPDLTAKQTALLFFFLQVKGAISKDIDKKTLGKRLRPLTGYSEERLRIALGNVFNDLEQVKNGRYQDDKEEVLRVLNSVTRAIRDA